jgi:hypothetical protein
MTGRPSLRSATALVAGIVVAAGVLAGIAPPVT